MFDPETFIETDPAAQAFERNVLLHKLGYTGPMLSPEDLTSTAPEHLRNMSRAHAFLDEIALKENLENGTYAG